MTTAFDKVAVEIAREGPRRYARWDPVLFDEVVRGPALALWHSLESQPKAEPVLTAYFQLLQEAVGAGYLNRAGSVSTLNWPNFLAFCLCHLIPASLVQVSGKDRLSLLARLWNIGEGLLREPAWLDRYVLACAGKLNDVSEIESFLVECLEPALIPARQSRWEGPFTMKVLDARPLDDDFLPGEMHLAAPAVVCVHDRRRSDVRLGLFLQDGQRSRFLGLTSCLGQQAAEDGAPIVKVGGSRIQIGSAKVDLLQDCWRHCVAASGFAVASAVDSQRLWIVESAS